MSDNVIEIGNRGFDLLDKVAEKTSPTYKSYNLVPLTIGIFGIFLVMILVDILAPTDIPKYVYITFAIIALMCLAIYAASFLLQDYLSMKRQEIAKIEYNQQYQNRN